LSCFDLKKNYKKKELLAFKLKHFIK